MYQYFRIAKGIISNTGKLSNPGADRLYVFLMGLVLGQSCVKTSVFYMVDGCDLIVLVLFCALYLLFRKLSLSLSNGKWS